MASHHHGHHHCQTHVPFPAATTNTTFTCCCYSHCCTQPHHPSPPPPPPPPPQSPVDPLLQSLVSLLQQQQQQQQSNLFSPHLTKPHHYKNHHQNPNFHPQKLHFQKDDGLQQTQFVLSTLLQRINTLESSLHQFTASTTNNNHHYYLSYSLRDTAARVIQTHFRAFLVHRSRTLSQLKELASIKSRFNSLKSSISAKTHFDFDVVSHKAMDLLLKLDSIQGGDPMIREGKRSVSRDLVRFLEFIDGFAVKRNGIVYKSAKNVRLVGNGNKFRPTNNGYGSYRDLSDNQKEMVEKLRKRVEKISGISRVCENDQEDVELEGFQQLIDDDVGEESRKVISHGKHGVLVKKHGPQPRMKKTVTFAENGNIYRVFSDTNESILNGDGSITDGSDSSDDHGEVGESHSTKFNGRKEFSNGTEKDKELQLENCGSSKSGDGERNTRRNLMNAGDYEINGYCLDQDESLVFSAPVTMKMESKADLMNKRKAVKIVT